MKDDRLYPIYIIECISRIEHYTSEGEAEFLKSTLIQDAVIRNLQTLAEFIKRVSAPLQAAHREVAWQGIARFRNVLVHDCLGVNIERVWEITEHGLEELKGQIEKILHELGGLV